jgi:hypothetical protein
MTTVALVKADLALFSDLTQRVQIPRLTASSTVRKYAGTTAQFAGDTFPTPFRGTTRAKTWQFTARYMAADQSLMLALINLVEVAANAPDSRLLLRTNYGQASGLDEATAVVVLEVDPAPQMGLYADLGFTCEACQFTLDLG